MTRFAGLKIITETENAIKEYITTCLKVPSGEEVDNLRGVKMSVQPAVISRYFKNVIFY
jgi:hypothetical protein